MSRIHTESDLRALAQVQVPPGHLLEMFTTMARIRAFETEVYQASEAKRIPLVYLSTGQESIPAALAVAVPGSWILAQHRGHGTYLAFGGSLPALRDELRGLPSGCCQGMGGSPAICDWSPEIAKGIIGHNGLIGDHVPVAVGVAYADRETPVVCLFGDGAAEEDYVLGAVGFAVTHQLNVVFVCEDNDLSVLTPVNARRSWNLSDVTRGFGLTAIDIVDDPCQIYYYAKELPRPCLLNIRTCRMCWHVGAGIDGPPEWDRYALVKADLIDRLGLDFQAVLDGVEQEAHREMVDLWGSP